MNMRRLTFTEAELLSDEKLHEYIEWLTGKYIRKPNERKKIAKEINAIVEWRSLCNETNNKNNNK